MLAIPAQRASCRIVGPVNESSINPLCGRPYGGPLLKWDWASSSFQPVPGIKAAGFRVTIMPETHMPWVVDGCGQLRGFTASLKSVYGPAPPSTLATYYDIAAVNGTGTAAPALPACLRPQHIAHMACLPTSHMQFTLAAPPSTRPPSLGALLRPADNGTIYSFVMWIYLCRWVPTSACAPLQLAM